MRNAGRILLTVALVWSVAGGGLAQEVPLSPAEQEAVVRLQSGKVEVRRDAAKKLGELRSRGAAEQLARAATEDPDAAVRRAAVVALGRVGDRARAPEMMAALKDPDAKVRGGAIEGLVNLYLDRDERFFTRVRGGLVRIVPFWDERQTAAVEPYVEVDPAITAALGEALKDADAGNRVAAVRALGALRAASQVDAMADAMGTDTKLRHEVLDSYVLIGETGAATYAIPFFESEDADLAAHAMVATGRLRAVKAVTPLMTVYGMDEPKGGVVGAVRNAFTPERKKAALQALALIGDPSSEGAFTENFYDRDPDRRRAAFEGIAREGDRRFVEVVTRAGQREKNEDVRLAQTFALYKLGSSGMMAVLVEALRTSSRRDQAAAYVQEATSPEHLVPFLRERNRESQRIVIDALGTVGDQTTVDALKPLVRGADPEIALTADRAIRRIEWRLAKP
jgi:HEAT repeat protein